MDAFIINILQDIYSTFNIIMRRKPKENNFKAVLETIRNLMNTKCVVPDWLHDIILGYGDRSYRILRPLFYLVIHRRCSLLLRRRPNLRD